MASTPNGKNIVHVPLDVDIDFNKALSEYVFEALTKNSNKIAQIDSHTGKTETFGELLNRSLNLAQSLKANGVTTNDIVGLFCYNNMDYLSVMTASIFNGAKFCSFDVTAPRSSILHCLKLTSPVLLFCEQESENILESCIKETGLKSEIIVFDKSDKFITLEDFIKKFKSNEKFEINTSRKMKDTGGIGFTSGTSGLAKGAELCNLGLGYGTTNTKRTFPDNRRTMIFTLPYWISNLCFAMQTLLVGITRVNFKKFDVKTLAKTVQDFQVNSTLLSQHIMLDLIQNSEYVTKYDTSSLKIIYIGGSKMGVNLIKELQKIFPHSTIMNALGMTEIAGLVFIPTYGPLIDASDNICVGTPIPGFYYKIVDTQNGEILGPNTRGELRVKYGGIINGYLHQPETTEEAFDEDGYFKTGDIVYYDDKYNFFLVDRLKEIFKFRGFHVSPAIIEDVLVLHPDIQDCAVIPVKHEHDGELPMAVVKLKKNQNTTAENIIQFIKERLEDNYHLRGGVTFVEDIPKTSTGKIRRKYLTELILGNE